MHPPPRSTLFPYTTLFRSHGNAQLGIEIGQRLVEQEHLRVAHDRAPHRDALALAARQLPWIALEQTAERENVGDRKSTRLNSSHLGISYAVFCLKKKKNTT